MGYFMLKMKFAYIKNMKCIYANVALLQIGKIYHINQLKHVERWQIILDTACFTEYTKYSLVQTFA